MSKQQIIEEIRRMNRTVAEDFLAHFNVQALENYLKRLSIANTGRGRESRWVRPGEGAAAVMRVH